MKVVLSLAAAALTVPPVLAQQPIQQKIRPPIAVYWMSAETAAGMSMPGMPQGMGGFGMAGMAGMPGMGSSMSGGKRLRLELGSSQAASGEPRAAHAIPPGLAMGPSLPLVAPRTERSAPSRTERGDEPEFERPKGRMLLYWGCGEAVRAGQPLVFDFSRMDPQEAARVFRTRAISRPSGPGPGRNRTYGDWPNAENNQAVPAQGSLRGDQMVSGNYSPEMRFAIGEVHDFMAPVAFEAVRRTAAGATQVGWRRIPTAIGHFATAMGQGSGENEVVMWSSSEVQEFGQALMDYLPPGEVQRLIKEKVVMPPQTTECTVPSGVFRGEGAIFNFIAYGNELNLVHPPRPSDLRQTWEQVWAVKLRLKSTGATMLAEMEGDPRGGARQRGRAQEGAADQPAQAPQREEQAAPPAQPSPGDAVRDGFNILRGIFGR
ncbi:MAG: hypothetical protein IT514_03530 [Burkholderiales bacterium]|nr:hypothetical protein [Burkholderiales bacterium]